MTSLQLKMDNLPEKARKELFNFYEYLKYKYLKNQADSKRANTQRDKQLLAFKRLKKLRDEVNPVADKVVDIDKLIDEVNNDIF